MIAAKGVLKIMQKIANTNAEGVRNAKERVQADPLFGAFDFVYVDRMEVGFLGESFLANAGFFAAGADSFA
jgi:hypothetical protein